MNGPYMFGVQRGRVAPAVAKKLDRIARQHGAEFVYANIPGTGPQSWFECANRGAPFDGYTQRRVAEAVEAAGLSHRQVPARRRA